MKRGYLYSVVLFSVCILLSGCASIPELNNEQEEMVTEYAASLLLKYDSENHSRLVPIDSYISAYSTAKKMHDDAEKQYYDAIAAEEEARKAETKAQEELNSKSAEIAGEMHASDGTGGARVVDARSISDFIGALGFSIEYAGFDLLDSYPEDMDDLFFSIDATTGNDLLVIYFNVTNLMSETSQLDIFNMGPIFKISVNGGRYSSVFKALVEDDMSVYLGSFNGNESKRLVLITEVSEGTSVSELGLRISIGDDSITKSLN